MPFAMAMECLWQSERAVRSLHRWMERSGRKKQVRGIPLRRWPMETSLLWQWERALRRVIFTLQPMTPPVGQVTIRPPVIFLMESVMAMVSF